MSTATWGKNWEIGKKAAVELIDFARPLAVEAHGRAAFDRQLDGALGLHNLLCRQRHAYLADEVGTGKTLVALGTVALLLARKPDARIVIVVPKHGVAEQWVRDWDELITQKLQVEHLGLRDPLLARPVRAAEPTLAAHALLETLIDCRTRLPIVSLFAFRFLRGALSRPNGGAEPAQVRAVRKLLKRCGDDDEKRVQRFKKDGLKKLNQHLAEKLNGDPIDLLVVDESQVLRHPNNLTNTTLAGLLGLGPQNGHTPLVDRMLLVSATPMHRAKEDLYHQLSYIKGESAETIAKDHADADADAKKKYMVRRLRRFGKHTQYSYRRESPVDARPETVGDHLVLALSQKLLESYLAGSRQGGRGRFELGFMESFESYGESFKTMDRDLEEEAKEEADKHAAQGDSTTAEVSEPPSSEGDKSDASVAEPSSLTAGDRRDASQREPLDVVVLRTMRETWRKTWEPETPLPVHPKLTAISKLVAKHLEAETPEKLLIFLRRIKGATEVAGLAQTAYNEFFWGEVEKLGLGEKLLGTGQKKKDDISLPRLLSTKGRHGSWRDSYRRARLIICDESALDAVLVRHQTTIDSLVPPEGGSELTREFQERAFKRAPLDRVPRELVDRWFWEQILLEKVSKLGGSQAKDAELLRPIVSYRLARYTESKGGQPRICDIEKYLEWHQTRQESSFWAAVAGETCGYQTLLDEGRERLWTWELQKKWTTVLLGNGEGLLAAWLASRGEEQSLDRPTLTKMLLGDSPIGRRVLWRIRQFLDLKMFQLVRRQILDRKAREKTDKTLVEEHDPPRALKRDLFARAVTGEQGRDARQLAQEQFNSPGFPDVLAATDVMREGLDLHLFCRKVIHYGIAWSAGDLEQRIGRADRMFSRAYHDVIANHVEGALDVRYPVLRGSIDERQIAKVIRDKTSIGGLLDAAGQTNDVDPTQRSLNLDKAFAESEAFRIQQNLENQESDPYAPAEDLLLEGGGGDAAMNVHRVSSQATTGMRSAILALLVDVLRAVRPEESEARRAFDGNPTARLKNVDMTDVVDQLLALDNQPIPSNLGVVPVVLDYDGDSRDQRVRLDIRVLTDETDGRWFAALLLRSPVGVTHKRIKNFSVIDKAGDLAHERYLGAKLCFDPSLRYPWFAQKALLLSAFTMGGEAPTSPTSSLQAPELMAAIEDVAGLADHVEKLLGQDKKEAFDDGR